jgi:proteasome lid subunit RPN8/RPN11
MVPTPYRLVVPCRFYEEIVKQAREELPNECCGMLAGHLESGVGRVMRRYPLDNAAASPVLFESEPHSMLAAEKMRRQEGLEFLAVYHSHPTSPPIPSKTDLERNYSLDIANVILSLCQNPPDVRAWWLTADGYREAELEWTD